MREYLLRPDLRSIILRITFANIFVLRVKESEKDSVFDDLWRFLEHGYFFCYHMHFDEKRAMEVPKSGVLDKEFIQ